MLKHIIFDFDGTIADSTEIGLQIYNELSEKYHYKKLSRDEVPALFNKPIKERFKIVGIPLFKIPLFLIDMLAKYKHMVNTLLAYEGIKNLITSLKQEGFGLSIISSNSTGNIQQFLQENNLEYFDNIISSNNLFGKHKSLKNFIKSYNLNSNEIIYIGDELRDIQACKKVSVKIISVIWGLDPLDLLKSGNPDYICNKPEDLFEIIKSINP